MLPCFCIARTFYPADSVPPAFLWPGATVGWVGAPKILCRFSFQGGCIRSQLHSRLPDGGRMSSGSVAYSRWVQAPCRHSLNLQRGQHAGAGLGTGPHDSSGGQHDAVRCWLGLGSNDPMRCGLNSAHPTFATHAHLRCVIPSGGSGFSKRVIVGFSLDVRWMFVGKG